MTWLPVGIGAVVMIGGSVLVGPPAPAGTSAPQASAASVRNASPAVANPSSQLIRSRARPDLEVRSVRVAHHRRPYYMFRAADHGPGMLFLIKVKNVGDKSVRAGIHLRLRNSLTGDRLRVWNDHRPLIRPGKSHLETVDVRELPKIGRYRTRGCAVSRKDRNAGNNCSYGPGFTVIPRRMKGTVTMSYSLGGTAVEKAAATIVLNFRDVARAVRYDASGTLEYEASGTSARCTQAGKGKFPIDQAFAFTLAPDLSYVGSGLYRGAGGYRISMTCPSATYFLTGPLYRGWWIAPRREWGTDPGGVSGAFSASAALRWRWNLTVD